MKSSRTQKVFALSLGQGLTTVVTLVSGMVMARMLSQSQLATYRQTLLAYQVAVPLLSLGLSQAIFYYLPTEKNRARGTVVDALVVMVAMGLLYAGFIALGGNHLLAKRFSNPAIVDTLVYLAPLPLVMLPAGLLSAVLVVREQVNKLAVYNVLTNLAMGIGVVAACFFWKTPEHMVLAKVGVGVVTGLIGIGLMLRAVPGGDWRPRWDQMKAMVGFGIPLVAATALATLTLQLDKIIVSSICSPEEFAVYSNGAVEIPFIGIVTGSIASVILPDLRRMVSAGDYSGALALFRKGAEKSAIFLIPTMMFLMVSAEPLILTLFSEKYSGSVLPFQIYLLTIPMRIVVFGGFMMALGMNRVILQRSAAGLLANSVLSILFVYWMGYIGAILATLTALYLVEGVWCFAAISHAVSCRWRDVVPFKSLLTLAWVSMVACVPVQAFSILGNQFPSPLLLFGNGVCFVGSIILCAWLFKVNVLKEEFTRLWKRMRRRFLVPESDSH